MVVVLVEALPVPMKRFLHLDFLQYPSETGKRRFYCESQLQELTKKDYAE